jgi:CRISPR-associated exonuclease Cas4
MDFNPNNWMKTQIPEEDYIMISALQHYVFCPRQCGLIHVEKLWVENALTIQGNIMHERVHNESENEKRKDTISVRGLKVSSSTLGLTGQIDLVEFHKCSKLNGTQLKNQVGYWHPLIVEYKRGKPKKDNSDKIQLCAQAICLEDMLNINIVEGAVYYGKKRHRFKVTFDRDLRQETEMVINTVHEMIKNGITPLARFEAKCTSCSFIHQCCPNQFNRKRTRSYLNMIFDPA